MSLNREQGLCIGVFVVCGALVASWWSNAYKKIPVPRSKKLVIAAAPSVNDVQFPRVDEGRFDPGDRDFFVPPRDWNPLPPLAIELPPMQEIPAVGPPMFPGPAPSHSRLERQPAFVPALVNAVNELAGANDVAADSGTGGEAAPNDPGKEDAKGGANGGATGIATTGDGGASASTPTASQAPAQGKPAPAPAAPAGKEVKSDVAKEDPKTGKAVVDDQAAARRFDWISYKGEKRWYGRILNKDRMALLDDDALAIDFEQVDPLSGRSFGRNTIARDRLTNSGEHRIGFDFANTAGNRVLLREYAAVKDKSTATAYLQAARDCLVWREEDAKAVLAGATRLVDRALAIDPGSVDAWVQKAEIRELAYDTEGEFKVLEDAKAHGADDSRLKARRARLFRKLGLLESAGALLEEAIAQNSLDASSLRELGQLKLALGDAAAAQDAFDRATKVPSVTPELRQQLRIDFARALLYGGDVAGAFQSIDQLVRGGMATADAWVLRGVCHFLQKSTLNALADLKTAIDLDPRNRDAVYDLGVLLGLSGDLKAAMSRFAEADELDPLRGFDTECARGILMELGGDLERASKYYEHALELHPDHPFGMYRVGRLARRNENHEVAANDLAKALLEVGDMIDVLNELGYVALQADIYEDAEKYFSESLRREPDQVEVRELLAAALVRQNRIVDAKREFEAAAVNSDPTALSGVAFCAYREGDVEQALDKFAAAKGAAKSDAKSDIYLYADTLQKRIDDHRLKEQWVDEFEREQIKNDWNPIESAGPTISLEKGVVLIKGAQRPGEESYSEIQRKADGSKHILVEAEMQAGPQNAGFYGVRVVLEKGRGNAAGGGRVDMPFAEIAVAVFPAEKNVRIYVLDQDFTQVSQPWSEAMKLPPDFNPAEFHKLTIERTDWEKALFVVRFDEKTLTIAAKPAADGKPATDAKTQFVVPGMRKAKSDLKVSAFAAGKARENVDVGVTSVRIVRYKSE